MNKFASAHWEGDIKKGKGTISTQSGALKEQPYGFNTRFEDEPGTNPEELLGAAHAGCFTMQLSHMLAEAGHPADKLETEAIVAVEEAEGGGFKIASSHLKLNGVVPGIDHDKFMKLANEAKSGCPVSKALAGTEISMEAKLDH